MWAQKCHHCLASIACDEAKYEVANSEIWRKQALFVLKEVYLSTNVFINHLHYIQQMETMRSKAKATLFCGFNSALAKNEKQMGKVMGKALTACQTFERYTLYSK